MNHPTFNHLLMPFVVEPRQDRLKGMAFSLKGYCELVDITANIISADKTKKITIKANLCYKIRVSDEQWLTLTTEFEKNFFMLYEKR